MMRGFFLKSRLAVNGIQKALVAGALIADSLQAGEQDYQV
jgi:hypothetical protein